MNAPEKPSPVDSIAGAQTRFLLVLGLCGFNSALSLRALDPMLPLVSAEFGISANQAALLASVYALTYALGQLLLGAIGDAYGKVRTITVCVGLLAITLFLQALAPDFLSLIGIRAVSGVVGGGIIPLSLAMIGDRFPLAVRQVAMGRFLFVSIGGQMVGAAMSGIVAEAVGWRGVFAVSGLLAAGITVVAVTTMKPRPGAARRPFGIASFTAGNREVFRSPGALAFYLTVFVEGALVFAVMPFVAAFLAERDGIGTSGAGLALAGFGVGTIVYTLLVGPLLKMLGTTGLRLFGGILAGSGLVLFALPLPFPVPALLFFCLGFGSLMLHNTLQMTATELAPRVRGAALSFFAMSLFLGQSVGPIAFGIVSAATGLPVAVVCTGLLLAGLGAMAAYAIRRA
jgi:predicted MFS family arabinose efflux permease